METSLLDAVTNYIGTTSPKAVSEALGTIGKWGATEADYIAFLQSKGFTVLQGTNGRYTVYKVGECIAGNGNAAQVASVFETTATEVTVEAAEVTEVTATGTGAGLLGLDVGVAGAAIAPALGILAGVALYNIAPDFWDGIAATLTGQGKLKDGKVQALVDYTGKTMFDEETIEIYKEAFRQAGFFETEIEPQPLDNNYTLTDNNDTLTANATQYNNTTYYRDTLKVRNTYVTPEILATIDSCAVRLNGQTVVTIPIGEGLLSVSRRSETQLDIWWGTYISKDLYDTYFNSEASLWLMFGDKVGISGTAAGLLHHLHSDADGDKYVLVYTTIQSRLLLYNYYLQYLSDSTAARNEIDAALLTAVISNDTAQDGATLPTESPFPNTYPDWLPSNVVNNINYYPVSMPTPQNTQDPSQTGDNDEDEQQNTITDIIFNPSPLPTPDPIVDPDPQPEPDPEPEPEPEPQPDPINPNPEPDPSDPTPVVPPIATTTVSSLFTVYNPTDGQLDALGAFLWTTSIIEQIKKIWQNPIEGVISLHKVYSGVVTGSSKNIILGYVDSGVSALEVTNQFATVDCGSITVSEKKQNATDYSPFTQLQLYLPFIGIQEIDTNEVMNGTLHVVYKVDVYTGTCIAMVFCQRSPDMVSEQLLYTFSGNASQKLPLTASDFGGAISALLGIVGVGVASGGALGVAAGALGVAHSLTSDMVHIQHSGGLSANSGIMAPRKPFLIISRQQGYDANGYAGLYGYPANKTVYLSNCTGYVRVKNVLYRGDGTDEEKREIVELLQGGVIL